MLLKVCTSFFFDVPFIPLGSYCPLFQTSLDTARTTSMSVRTTFPPRRPLRLLQQIHAHSRSAVSNRMSKPSPSRNSSRLRRRSPQLLNNRSSSHAKLKRLSGRSVRRWKNCLLTRVLNASNSLKRKESASTFTQSLLVGWLTVFVRSGAFSNVYKAFDLTSGTSVAGMLSFSACHIHKS